MNISNANRQRNLFAIVFILLMACMSSYGQYTINGPSTANQGQTYQYYISGAGYNSINWQVYYGGTIQSGQYGSTVTVLWTVGTSGTVGAVVTDYMYTPHYLSKNVTITPTTPSAPPPPTVQSINCGNTVLTRPEPPSGSGITYYWQGSASGTDSSPAAASSTITKTAGGIQYLRARNGGGTWSTSSSSLAYTVNQVPSEPTGQNNYRCGGEGPVYILATPGSNANSIRWYSTESGGALLHTGTSYLTPSISSTTTYYAQSYNSDTGCVSPYRVAVTATVYQILNPGEINGTKTICYNSSAGTLGNATSPSAGDGSFAYQWQQSSDNSSWTNISGATASVYSPGTLTATHWYRRGVVSCGETKYTSSVNVIVQSALNAGTITGTQTICYNGNPYALGNSSSPSGGDSFYIYQWQESSNNSAWSNIIGANAVTYDPGALTSDRWYRRSVSSCGETKYTSSVNVIVSPALNEGAITGTQTICYNGDPSALGNSSSASGGDSSYSYQWQVSSDGSSWSNISGATAVTYDPGALTSDRWYRRSVSSCGETKYTSSVNVSVRPVLNAGSVTGDQTLCYNGNPSVLGNSSSPSGGDSSYSYQWQESSNNSAWSNIIGANAVTYDPGALTSDRWYRRSVYSCGETKYTSSVKVTIRPALNAGAITGTQTICYNGDPSALGNSSSASGGDSSYSYQWQVSSDGSSWSNISGATAVTYDPGALTSDRWYRRSVSSCGETKYTSSVNVTVRPVLNAGSVTGDQTLCYNGNPSVLGNSSSPSGGDSSYGYQWQLSSNNTTWSNISGATAVTYDPGPLTSDRWYRRSVSSCGETKYTSSVKVTVWPNMVPGAINGTKTICSGSDAGTLGSVASPTGGDGTYSYLWQQSSDNSSWTNISGATGSTYAPGTVTATRWYRRQVVSCTQTAYSASVKVTITATPTWYADTDGDTYGNPAVSTTACSAPAGYVSNNSDYDDSTINITNIAPQYFYGDSDGDGFGDPNDSKFYSVKPSGYVSNNTDSCPTEPGTYNGCDYTPATLSDENYIYTRAFQREMYSESEIYKDTDIIESITYFDGLGRPKQSIGIKASPSKKDIITHVGYDEFGRQDKDWLPYHENLGNVGSYRGDKSLTTQQYYQSNYANDFVGVTNAPDINAFSQKEFEQSPLLDRVLLQAAPGKDWKLGGGREIGFNYWSNITSEVVRFGVTITHSLSNSVNVFTPALTQTGNYGVGELYKTVTKDENWTSGASPAHTTEEFKDKESRVVLKRTYGNSDDNMDGDTGDPGETNAKHNTYYVYDDYGNLTYVIPPKVNTADGVSGTELSELCYQYRYDSRNRLVEKKIPGKGWEYIVYDDLDRPVLTQDGNQRVPSTDEWLFTKYDVFGRVVYTGIYDSNSTRTALQYTFNNKSETQNYETKVTSGTGYASTYYTNANFPNTSIEILTVNYYDNYYFDKVSGTSEDSYGITPITNTKGLATGSKVKVLTTSDWITTVSYYDTKSMPIYVYSFNDYLDTTDKVKSQLDFAGKVMETTAVHSKVNFNDITTVDTFTYDHVGRLVSQKQKINTLDEELIALNAYDDLGQLKDKKVGGDVASNIGNSLGLQKVDYTYNVRGWLKQINDPATLGTDLFGFKIGYNEGANPLFNGNIALTQWRTANTDNSLKNYNYAYDALNRILAATDNSGHYNLSNVVYDRNGNIVKLNRAGHLVAQPDPGTPAHWGNMDVLTYTYQSTSNKLLKVADAAAVDQFGFKDDALNIDLDSANDYSYDTNGNMLKDINKAIGTTTVNGITYNHLNLPLEVKFNNSNTQKINYIYDATGVKLEKKVTEGSAITRTLYAGNQVYQGLLGAETLKFFNHPEGYVDVNASSFNYVYQYKDHLGNIRLSYQDIDGNGSISASTEILEENNYYPFGLRHTGYNDDGTAFTNPALDYKYNGVELENAFGLNLYEMDVRSYDPATARFTSIDPVTHFSNSTYNAFDNNPVYWADPSGADSWTYVNNGNYRNNKTGEETDDWQRAINETQSHFSGSQNKGPLFKKTGKGTYYNEASNTHLTFNNRKEIKSKDYIKATGEFSIGPQTKDGGTFLGKGIKSDVGLTASVASIEILSTVDETIINISMAVDSESLKEIISSSVISAEFNYGFFGTSYKRDGEGNIEYDGNISALSLRDGDNGASAAIKISEVNTSFGSIGGLDFFGLSYNVEFIFQSSGRPKKSVRGQVRAAELEYMKKIKKK